MKLPNFTDSNQICNISSPLYKDKTQLVGLMRNNYSDIEEQDHHRFWSEYEMTISGLNIGLDLSK